MQVGALIIDCIIQLAGWLISAALKTDKFYDMLGKHQAAQTPASVLFAGGQAAQARTADCTARWDALHESCRASLMQPAAHTLAAGNTALLWQPSTC